jgi:uridine kinase
MSARICAVQTNHTLRVGINGIDAAGKTTLADELAPLIRARGRPVIRATIDGFHNPRAVRYARGPLSPQGYFQDSFNLQALIALLLGPLGPDGDGRYSSAVFDYRVDAPTQVESQQALPGAILLFDGIFLARPELVGHWDLFIFVQISAETCLARAWERNKNGAESKEEIRHRYQVRYLPAQRDYLATCRPTDRADFILVNDDPADPQLIIGPLGRHPAP